MKTRNVYLSVLSLLVSGVVFVSFTTPDPERPVRREAYTLKVDNSYSFIQYNQNHLQFYGKQHEWKLLFDKMEKLAFTGEGKVNVVHIGGSHVQGGFLPDKMRYNLTQLLYGAEGERGLIFPYELAKTNSPRSIKCKYTGRWTGCRSSVSSETCGWGMSGITATTYDKDATLTIRALNYDSTASRFDEVHLYSSAGRPGSMQVIIPQALDPMGERHSNYIAFRFAPNTDSLRLHISAPDSSMNFFTLDGLYLRNSKSGLTYNAIGVNGASTASYLKCNRMDDQLSVLQPDLVIFAIGVNDANVPERDFDADRYEARYDSLIHKFKKVNPHVSLLFVTNNDTYFQKSHPNKNALQVRNTMIKLARKHNGAVYDFFGIMGGLGSIKQWQNASLAAADKIHLSKRGYELQADMMSVALRDAFGYYLDKHELPD